MKKTHFTSKINALSRWIAIVLLSIISNNICAQQWSTRAPMLNPRAAFGATVFNNLIYVMGGFSDNQLSSSTEVYDPSTNTWSLKASIPTPRNEPGITTVNGKIYVIGGYNGIALNVVEEYNPATDTWTTKANMPTSRSNVSVTVLNNKIFAIGGWPNGINSVEVYDPVTDTWTAAASLAQGRITTNGSTTLLGEVYFTGGKTNSAIFSTHEAYNASINSWTSKSDLPAPRWTASSVTLNNKIHFLGGTDNYTPGAVTPNYANNFVYDPINNSWSEGIPMLHTRSNHSAVVVENKIFVLGGMDESGLPTNLNEVFSNCNEDLNISSSNFSINIGSTATFTAISSDSNPSYVWQSNLGQGFQTLNNIGNYSGTNSASMNISNIQLSEHNQPIRVISTSGECVDTSDVAYVSITDTCINFINDTTFVTVTDTLIINTLITDINALNNTNTIKVFPNPANDHITIDYGNFAVMNGYQLKIQNSIGQQVFQTNITQQTDYLSLNNWGGNGIYFVHIIDAQGNTIDIRKIVLQ